MTRRPDIKLRALTSYRLRRATVSVMALFNQVFAAFGLRRTTFSALTLVVDNPGLRQSDLADALAIERPNVVQIVDELERLGLVQRCTAEDDRRAYALHATAEGRRLQNRAMQAARDCDTVLVRGLSQDQLEALHSALGLLQANARTGELPDVCKLPNA